MKIKNMLITTVIFLVLAIGVALPVVESLGVEIDPPPSSDWSDNARAVEMVYISSTQPLEELNDKQIKILFMCAIEPIFYQDPNDMDISPDETEREFFEKELKAMGFPLEEGMVPKTKSNIQR